MSTVPLKYLNFSLITSIISCLGMFLDSSELNWLNKHVLVVQVKTPEVSK